MPEVSPVPMLTPATAVPSLSPSVGRSEGGGRGLPPHRVVLGGATQGQPSSFRIDCVDWLAWASIEVPAWVRTWARVKLVISDAMSVSRIRDSEAVVFSMAVFRLLTVWSNRFWMAPRSARCDDTVLIAASMAVIAFDAPVAPENVAVAAFSVCAVATPVVVSPSGLPPAPVYPVTASWTWKVRLLPDRANGL